jgi:hypothetical protein
MDVGLGMAFVERVKSVGYEPLLVIVDGSVGRSEV